MPRRRKLPPRPPLRHQLPLGVLALGVALVTPVAVFAQQCERTLTADVVALDETIFYNRLGAFDPAAMMFALRRDVVPIDGTRGIVAGNVQLRPELRPRPLTLRMNVGDCLRVEFQNLLDPVRRDHEQPATRTASVHVMGVQAVNGIGDDGSNVGANPSSLVAPGGTATYTFYAEREGTFLLYSTAATTGGEGDGGSLARGLFGALNVQPRGAEWYRSQLTAAELELATAKDADGLPRITPAGHPVVDYDAVFPAGHPRAGLPILAMLQGGEIVHAELNAIITGPGKGDFPAGTYPEVEVAPDRNEPFREFTIIFHDEIGIVQAFDVFEDPMLEHTLHSGRDAFAINYGTGGVGAEVIANRARLGPMWDCNECKYEEFFLSSWTVGDPSMVVDVPANADLDGDGSADVGPKATKVLYPSDPSNVYHSYMNDHVKFRNLHAGPKEHHIFHLHAHQWLHTPDADNSTYLDSQAIGPGGGYTYEITHGGSGNRNKTPGDAVFHCHFYPHFAQGMWALWRNHDVFESGTDLDADGRPAAGARALPDGEIAAGTPIPAVVPIPRKALPPMPGFGGNPGYPFFIPGVAGHRPPRPPLETVEDGGLPRHVVVAGEATYPALNPLDFHKDNVTMQAVELPETGTVNEKYAMRYHAIRSHRTYSIDPVSLGIAADTFVTNGLSPVAGAPYADPCVRDDGTPDRVTTRTYKAASFQLDVKYNKAGWHFPQHRMFALWDDVVPTLEGRRAPEPMFMRANSNTCVQYHLVNLVPHEYQMDDFQVLTPTDVIGQHIHLVKFDVTSSDGSANGFNYEDGSLSPGEVRERVHAIRKFNACSGLDSGDPRDGTFECPVARAHPYFGPGPNGEWIGAQETIQLWYADEVLNSAGKDRTLRTVFTHDHFGPSTHQQAGLYAGLVTEPAGSTWRDPETGQTLGTRFDGGPTSWRADILTVHPDSSYREFNLMVQDFALAYEAHSRGFPDPDAAISPPGRFFIDLPDLVAPPIDGACPNGNPAPCPELVSADDPGTFTVNYRNEPVALRVRDPDSNSQAAGQAGDLAYAFYSKVNRADPRFNSQPGFYPPLTGGVLQGDPFTPLIRAYEGDRTQIRLLVGAHEEEHNVNVHGLKWLREPSDPNSGYRSSQMMGLSEHYEFVLPPLPGNIKSNFADYLWEASASLSGRWSGAWGLLRAYRANQNDLLTLPNNPDGKADFKNKGEFRDICPKSAPIRGFDVTAVLARDALPEGTLVYNPRTNQGGALHDPTAILYVRTGDLDAGGRLRTGVPVEPLVLRARAGECIDLTLRNRLPDVMPDLDGYNALPMIVDRFNGNDVVPSDQVGLHPQLLAMDVTRNDGVNVGHNNQQTAGPGGSAAYRWYAGDLQFNANGELVAVPVEFGAVNLLPADPIEHVSKGAVGALVVEPEGSTWTEDDGSRAAATVTKADGTTFREFVLVFQDAVNMRRGANAAPVPPLGAEEDDPNDPAHSGQVGVNYRTEPFWKRMGYEPSADPGFTGDLDYTNALSNAQVGGDPATPVFTARAGEAVRFRVLNPGGHGHGHVFQLHGHIWQELPYTANSTALGDNPLSEWKGSQDGHGPTNHFDAVLQNGAGGKFGVPGDYLFRVQGASFRFDGGLWGILRVLPRN